MELEHGLWEYLTDVPTRKKAPGLNGQGLFYGQQSSPVIAALVRQRSRYFLRVEVIFYLFGFVVPD